MRKITLRQVVIMFSVLLLSPTLRLLPIYTTDYAGQAAFLGPIIAIPFMLIIVFAMSKIYKKEYENMSLCEISSEILGKIPSKIILFVYGMFLIVFLSIFLREYSGRLTSTAYTNSDFKVFIIIMLIFSAYVIKKGIHVLARMSEIILPIILGVLGILCAFIIPMINLKFFNPISGADFMPVIRSSVGPIGFLILIVPIFFISNYFRDFSNIMKVGTKTMIFSSIISAFVIFVCIGSLSKWMVLKVQYPFLSSVKLISIFKVIEKLESLVVAVWIASDFVLVSLLSIIIIKVFKYIFNIKNDDAFVNIFMLFIFLMSLMIATDSFAVNTISSKFILETSMFFGVGLIFLLYVVMKTKDMALMRKSPLSEQ